MIGPQDLLKITVFDEAESDQQLPGRRRRLHHVPLHRPRRGGRADAGGAAGSHPHAAGGGLHQEPAGARGNRRVQEPERARERRSASARQDHDDRRHDAARGARGRRFGHTLRQQRTDRRAPEEAGCEAPANPKSSGSTGRTCSSARARDVGLQDGDIINVPKAQTFFITGQVRNGVPTCSSPARPSSRRSRWQAASASADPIAASRSRAS